MSTIEITSKIEALKELETLIEEAKAEAETLRDEIKSEMLNRNGILHGRPHTIWSGLQNSKQMWNPGMILPS